MTRILVTGGAGYVGAVSVEAFLAAGHDVVVLDDLSTGHRSAVPDGARLIVGDYADRATAAAVFAEESIDAVLHCAARSVVGSDVPPGVVVAGNPARVVRKLTLDELEGR